MKQINDVTEVLKSVAYDYKIDYEIIEYFYAIYGLSADFFAEVEDFCWLSE